MAADPLSLDEIEHTIASLHARIQDAYTAGNDGWAEFYAYEIHRLETLRPYLTDGTPTVHALLRMRRRSLGEQYARARWAQDDAKAARLLVEIERLERGQV